MSSIGIKLADGSFYPVIEEGKTEPVALNVTTAKDNQTTVHIDLYRTDDGTMENAQYVDTLEISDLNPHPNGEPNLNLELELDENNELHAKVSDPETGISSKTKTTIVTRTEEERNEPANFNLAGGVLAGDAISENILSTQEKSADNLSEETEMIEPAPNNDDFSFEELNKETLAQQGADEAQAAADDFEFSDSTETSADTDDISVTGDVPDTVDTDAAPADDFSLPEDTADSTTDSSTDFDLPDFDSLGSESVSDDTVSTEDTSFDLPDFGDESSTDISDTTDTSDTPLTDEDLSLPDFGDETSAEPTVDSGADSEDFSLPDFGDETSADLSGTEDVPDTTDTSDAADSSADFDLPDFGDDTVSSEDFSLPDFGDESSADSSDNFDLPDFDSTTSDDAAVASGISGIFDEDFGEPDLNVSEDKNDNEFASTSGMFDDLYDDKDQKKSKAPLIICLLVAILLVIGAVLLLFVIPSKLNITNKIKSRVSVVIPAEEPPLTAEDTVPEPENPYEAPVEPEFKEPEPVIPEPEPEPVVTAKEDEIVIATTPVVPETPPAPKTKPADIHYKIKWGDTLWDISKAYYKNPWRYKMLAKYNGIKDPDYIVSGTWIWIPAE